MDNLSTSHMSLTDLTRNAFQSGLSPAKASIWGNASPKKEPIVDFFAIVGWFMPDVSVARERTAYSRLRGRDQQSVACVGQAA